MSGDILHPRKEIRDSVFDILKERVSGIKSFSKNRFRSFWEDSDLPALGVYTLQESSEVFVEAPRNLKRILTLVVEIVVQADEKLDDLLDQLSLAVENAIHVDETLRCKANDCRLVGTDLMQKTEGDMLTGSALLSFEIKYFTDAPSQQVLNNYNGADFVIEVGDADTVDLEGTADVNPL